MGTRKAPVIPEVSYRESIVRGFPIRNLGNDGLILKLWGLFFFILLVTLLSPTANATDKKQYTVSQATYKVLTKSRKFSDKSQFTEAIRVLKNQLPKTIKSRYETAMIHQHLAYIYLEQHHYRKAISSLESTLKDSHTLPPDSVQSLRYNLAQVYMQTEQYRKALPVLEQWFQQEKKPTADAWYLKSLAYYKLKKYASAVAPLKKAIAKSPHEDWSVLLLSIHLEQKHYRQAATVLNQLLDLYPHKKKYWMHLTDVHLMLKDYGKALVTLKLAYKTVPLAEKDIVRLAQLYMHKNIPYSAADLLLKNMQQKKVKRNARNLELLANSWAMAREHKKELKYLKQAANIKNDGKLYQRCGQILLQLERWNEAIPMLKKALAKGGLKQPQQSYLLMGIAGYNANKFKTATWAFTQAGKYKKTKKQAERWLQQVKQKTNEAPQG
jgi:tetratricopeptide (TPR) repeat protein